MKEIWKDISGYEGIYMASKSGKIKSIDRTMSQGDTPVVPLKGKMLTPGTDWGGYLIVILADISKRRRTHRVHRLIAKTFIPNPDNKPQVNHKDGNKWNNNDSNLEWCTASENIRHASNMGLLEKKKYVKLNDFQIRVIKKSDLSQKELSEIFRASINIINKKLNDR